MNHLPTWLDDIVKESGKPAPIALADAMNYTSQTQVAARAGVRPSYVSYWANVLGLRRKWIVTTLAHLPDLPETVMRDESVAAVQDDRSSKAQHAKDICDLISGPLGDT